MPLSKETLQYRKENNLCPRCGNSNELDKSMCRKHLDQFAQKANSRRKNLKILGKCEQCQKDLDRDGTTCTVCFEKRKPIIKRANKKKYENKKSSGLCMSCENPAVLNKTRCQNCLDHEAQNRYKRRLNFESNNQCAICGKDLPVDNKGKRCDTCIEKWKLWYVESGYKERLAFMRDEDFHHILDHYGTRCVCCGQDEPKFLTVDHIDGKGNEHRKKIKKYGSGFYKWLIDQNFPCGFQILCYNCNMGKYRNGGTCPHKSDN